MKKITLLLQRLGIILMLFTLTRVIFYLANSTYFPEPGIAPFLHGIRFDLATIVFLNIPFILLSLLPLPLHHYKGYRRLLAILYILPNAAGLLANLIDTAYFPFSLKRSTAAMFKIAGLGDDTLRLMPQFLRDYWYLLLLLILMVMGMVFFYRRSTISYRPLPTRYYRNLWGEISIFLMSCLGFLVLARGGTQLRPIDVYNAADQTGARNMALVLNTPFTIIKTWNSLTLQEKHYFPEEEVMRYYDTRRQYKMAEPPSPEPNVVLLILESFSREFVGFLSQRESYTPFLDSLLEHSWTFRYSLANAKKSIEALPAIVSSIPALMDDAYITSAYSSNKIRSLANILKSKGYHTSFFHGATNGSMGFDGFSRIAGFDTYFGRTEYGDEQDFDGSWGIWDEPFLQRWGNFLNKEEEPFFSAVFTLSSHHPFHIPDQYQNRFKEGPRPIHKCIRYTDYSLRRFFDTIKDKPWYAHTLFVITADHTFSSTDPFYSNSIGQYAIPIAFFKPDGSLQKQDTGLIQQIDIMPTILQLIGHTATFNAFGQSALQPQNFAINYRNQTYQLIQNHHLLQWVHDRPKALYNLSRDSFLHHNILNKNTSRVDSMANLLKAFIQTYNHKLIHNDMEGF